MLLGAGTDTVTDDYTLDQKFAEFRRLCLDFVEVPLRSVDASARAEGYRELAAAHGLTIASAVVAEFVRLPDVPEIKRAEALRKVVDTALTAVDLGCDLVLIPVRVKAEEPQRAVIYAKGYAELLAATDTHGTVIAAEFVGGALPAEAADLVRSLDNPRARLFFDVGNCLYAGADPVADLRELLPLVAQVHLKGGPDTPLAAMPLRELHDVLRSGGFTGRSALEIESPKGRQSLRDAVSVLQMYGLWTPTRGGNTEHAA
ncbi:sugar phosphate isomerase/epimerase family protein [Streptomyces sp. SID8352]|uniref:sugar phosphate isomerase/epimerase family protein n=1 Tax=Streptomyces sp. SID8352 TaxID=2690338 RepID=UPI00137146E5|nr:sugar phosphate isomerase/epimerase family protein [Streptomyces sp. SID8352]MYU23649.1 TIM barrel protein [Streptomyces sp. SID8352]